MQFPRLRFILNHLHVQTHLYQVADAMGLRDADREAWRRQHAERVAAEAVRAVIAELRNETGPGRKEARRVSDYLQRFQDSVHYNAYEARGLPIGSGEVESAHRYVVQQRLKLPGATWKPETINPMLALRVVRANGSWERFCRTRGVA